MLRILACFKNVCTASAVGNFSLTLFSLYPCLPVGFVLVQPLKSAGGAAFGMTSQSGCVLC